MASPCPPWRCVDAQRYGRFLQGFSNRLLEFASFVFIFPIFPLTNSPVLSVVFYFSYFSSHELTLYFRMAERGSAYGCVAPADAFSRRRTSRVHELARPVVAASCCLLALALCLDLARPLEREEVRVEGLELEASRRAGGRWNVAKSCGSARDEACPTFQSSTASGGLAARAVDGTNSSWWNRSTCEGVCVHAEKSGREGEREWAGSGKSGFTYMSWVSQAYPGANDPVIAHQPLTSLMFPVRLARTPKQKSVHGGASISEGWLLFSACGCTGAR